MHKWVKDGAEYNEWKTPQLTRDLRALKTGKNVISPTDGSEVKTAKYIVFDGPLGRAHDETARLIDFMVYIDTPLGIAMARRLLRDFDSQSCGEAEKSLEYVKSELCSYLKGGRAAYREMDKQIKPDCDLALNGSLSTFSKNRGICAYGKLKFAAGTLPRIIEMIHACHNIILKGKY
jgi:hypothetical protein